MAAPDNPYYNKVTAIEEAIEMFWNEESVSTEAILYFLDNDYLPDIYNEEMFVQKNTKEEKLCDAHFLLRYMRKENY